MAWTNVLKRQMDNAELLCNHAAPLLSGHPNVPPDQQALATLIAGILIAAQLESLASNSKHCSPPAAINVDSDKIAEVLRV